MQKLKKGDEVSIIAGKDKGKRGEILRVLPKLNRLVVKGVNLCKKHVKPNASLNEPGGIVQREMSIDISNVNIWNALANRSDRVGFKILEDGKKVRVFKSNGERVEQ
jgi:large subunit ribosomal protein L24